MSDARPTACKRPVLRWHGGKWRLAPWIISHFPSHKTYVEPYGGAASVLLRKPRCYAEIYNDIDASVVTLFRVLRDPAMAAELREALRLTPFARREFNAAKSVAADAPLVEQARALVVRSCMGFGTDSCNPASLTGFRANSQRSGTTPAIDWAHYPDALDRAIERLRGVIIENRPALEVMRAHDGRNTLHYLDPPYIAATRCNRAGVPRYKYAVEMSDVDHAALLAAVMGLAGMVVISGYDHPLYRAALSGWQCYTRAAWADGARPRTEHVWLNPAAIDGVHQVDMQFGDERTLLKDTAKIYNRTGGGGNLPAAAALAGAAP